MLHKHPILFFLLGILLAFILWVGVVPYLCCARISYPMVSGDTSYIQLPFFQNSSSTTARFNVKASLYYLPLQAGVLWVRPDDCVDKILINDNSIDDAIINNQPHCSDTSVTTIVHVDVTPYLHPGQNEVEIQFSDKGGQYGLDAGISHKWPVIAAILCVLAAAFYSLCGSAGLAYLSRLRQMFHVVNVVEAQETAHDNPLTFVKKLGICTLIVALSLLYLYPILSTHEWYVSHARIDYLYEMEMFKDSFSQGQWYPRWLPKMEGGYGYPTFLFIAPGLFFLTLPFTYLFSNMVFAFYASLLVMTSLGGFGAYKLARLYCKPAASITCLALFFTTHYLAVNLFARGDITEFAAMMLCPWALYYFLKLADGIAHQSVAGDILGKLTATLFAILVMHPLVFLYCAIPGCLMLVGKWVEEHYNPNILIVTGLCALLALVLGSPYWLTTLQMKPFIHQGGVFVMAPAKSMTELFTDGFFNPGKLQVMLALLGWLCSRRNVFMRYVFLSWFVLLFLMTDYADAVWRWDTPMKYSQFTWRINSVLATVQLLGIIQLARFVSLHMQRLGNETLRLGIWIAIPLCIVFFSMFSLSFSPFSIAFKEPYRIWGTINYEAHKKEWEQKEFIYAGVYREFFPATANYDNLPNRLTQNVPLVETGFPDRDRITMNNDSSDYRIHFKVEAKGSNTAQESSVLINQMYFPGWHVMVNDRPALFSTTPVLQPNQPVWSIGDRGRLRIDFPDTGTFDIRAWYDGPPDWEVRNAIIIVLAGFLVCILYWQRRAINVHGQGL